MKKLLSLILVLLLAAAVFIAYQWRQAADRLNLAARGGIYRNLGLKLELAPARDGVKGLSRLKPYVEIPQVVFDLSGWGIGGPIPLGSARLSTSLWQSSDFLLVFDAGSVNRPDLEAKRLAFELAVPDRILGARAEALTFSHPSAQEKLVLKGPWLQIGFQEGVIPERANFRIDAIDYTKEGSAGPAERLHFGVLETNYQSERRGSLRHWKFLHSSDGGSFEFSKAHGGIQPWSYQSEGSFAEIPLERWKSLAADWKSLAESQPSGAPPWADFTGLSARLVAFVTELRPQIGSLEMRWGGMNLQGADKSQTVAISPMDFQLKYEDAAQGLKANAKGGMKGVQVQWGDQRFEFSNLTFSQDSSYAGMSYQDWLKYFLRYYAASFAMQKAPERVL
ncbi:MAG: hypothetical protein K8R69_04120 [Deltaproteobacteria bacterium]|nr:hypothetical protein [Deltaproteobacteria bacterium]